MSQQSQAIFTSSPADVWYGSSVNLSICTLTLPVSWQLWFICSVYSYVAYIHMGNIASSVEDVTKVAIVCDFNAALDTALETELLCLCAQQQLPI